MRRFYLIGKSLDHSFSPAYFKHKFIKQGLADCHYDARPIPDLTDFRNWALTQPNLVGVNVTIPYKTEIIQHLDELDQTAAKIGAVNTILKKGNRLIGFNTDATGFKLSLLNLNRNDRKALVLGTGGASKAVCFVLNELGIAWNQVSRKMNTSCMEYDKITEALITESTIIVNCTSLGMHPHVDSFPEIPYQFLTKDHLCYDLVYNPTETAFMKKSGINGATVKNGYEMLELQAEAAWEIWSNGLRVND